MTLTLEIAPELEREIEQQAQQQGQSVAEYVAAMLREKVLNSSPQQTSAKPRRVASGFGKYAGRGRTVDDFLAERRAEAEMEMRQAEERDRLRAGLHDRP